jgi:hypothetical protein
LTGRKADFFSHLSRIHFLQTSPYPYIMDILFGTRKRRGKEPFDLSGVDASTIPSLENREVSVVSTD